MSKPDHSMQPGGSAPLRRALFSLSEVPRALPLAQGLAGFGWELWASDGTAERLRQAGLSCRRLSELTGVGTLLGGRVKTLHPIVFAGVLARPTADDARELESLGGVLFDMVVVDFYPFEARAADLQGALSNLGATVELIDIGGPSLVRAAAKNYARVCVVCHPDQYARVLAWVQERRGDLPDEAARLQLAAEAFTRTAAYDTAVGQVLRHALQAISRPPGEAAPSGPGEPGAAGAHGRSGVAAPGFPPVLELRFSLWQEARYGENPHQPGAIYRTPDFVPSVPWGRVLQGKELSYNNVADAAAAWALALDLPQGAAACAIKHGTPCGVAVADSPARAYERAHAADPVSIFGGVVALNRPVDAATARLMLGTFLEVVVAPAFTPEALEILAARPRLRLIEVGAAQPPAPTWEVRSVPGGLLVQWPDTAGLDEGRIRVVTRAPVPDSLWPDLRFAWTVVKHARSNAVVVAREGQTLGIGAGQVSRIDAARLALDKAGERALGAVLASDGFFPFSDVVELAGQRGIAAIIQPGGSIRDHESVAAADQAGIAMVMTGIRHFRH